MPYPKVSAAEKYAEIGGRENAPPCKHGLQKWSAHAALRAGGYWQCQHESNRRTKAKHLAAGRCSQCGKNPIALDSVSKCAECLTWQVNYLIKADLRANGVDPEQIYKEMGWDET